VKYQHGFAFPDADEFMLAHLGPDGRYQASHLDAALAFVTDFSIAVDGGAHVGTWSRTLSTRFARVIAVEPSPDTFEALTENLRAFGCANVETKAIALGASHGSVQMILDGKGAAMHNTGARYVMPRGPIRMEPIDAWNLPSLGFLKLDVEGSEPAALVGARATLLRCRPIVLFENKGFWKRYGLARDTPQRFLESCGYHERQRMSMDVIWGPR